MEDSGEGEDEYEAQGVEGVAAMNDESRTPLYCGSRISKLDATLLVMNVCRTHKATNACISELLHLMSKVILPSPNSLPTNEGLATRMVARLGLRYDTIDACRNGCVLFRHEYAEMDTCPQCSAPRYRRVGLSNIPQKVLRHFPIIPRLRRMFSTPQLAAMMTWHASNKSEDGKMRGPVDSPQWEHIRVTHVEFERESRNLHLGLCADGINPHSQKRSTHSLCPVLLVNYNIPPWLTIKKFFIMLALLIPGPEAVTAGQIDVYLGPLIEELKALWEVGVLCYDAARWRGEVRFTLRAILLWCVHDFPAYAMLAGTTNKGYCACPICGPNTPSRYSDHLSKVVYGGSHRRWLPRSHPFRYDVNVFGSEELRPEPEPMDATTHIQWSFMRAEYARFGGRLGGEGDPVLCSGVKRLPLFFKLPYWKVSVQSRSLCLDIWDLLELNDVFVLVDSLVQDMPVRHVLDVMHIEKNIAESVLKFLFGEKDTPESRRDMQEMGQRRELWLRPRSNRLKYFKPPAPYVFTDAEKKLFVDAVSAIRTPTGYGSALGKHLKKDRFMGLKSHDYHCLVQQIIPVAIRTMLQPLQRTALIRLGKCFSRICARVVLKSELETLRLYVVETMCILEVCFPPSFFDIMQHTLVHLVDEVEMCGPVGGRWMYPFERYLGTLKSYVRSRAHPEACIANGYSAEEALGFCTEYENLQAYTSRHVWEEEEEVGMKASVVEGRGRVFNLSGAELAKAHMYIIEHHACTQEHRRYDHPPGHTKNWCFIVFGGHDSGFMTTWHMLH